MRIQLNSISAVLLLSMLSAGAASRFVDVNCPTPAAPYTSWATAATRIQDAVDAATEGDEIIVTNGNYRLGGRVVHGSLTNRVAVIKPLILRSVNGPSVTFIEGFQHPGTTNGSSSVRCVYLTNNASIFGFTLTNGATHASGHATNEQSGAGIWCASSSSVVSNCHIIRNGARNQGGGAWSGSLIDCTLTNNYAFTNGGGAAGAVLTNCQVLGNFAGRNGGGLSESSANYCVISNNTARFGGGTDQSRASDCTITANRAYVGGGVFAGAVFDSAIMFNYSTNSSGGADGATLTGCAISGNQSGVSGGVGNCVLINCSLISNSVTGSAGGAGGSTLYGCLLVENNAGKDGGGANGCNLYDSVIATNRANNGGGAAYSTLNNCQLMGNFATNYGGGTHQGGSLTNCVLLANQAGKSGGGASSPDYVYRCAFTNNTAGSTGGGMVGSYAIECTLDGNSALAGGGAGGGGWLIDCLIVNNRADKGGGSSGVRLTNCVVQSNFATNNGGGVYGSGFSSDFINCVVVSNTASSGGGFYDDLGTLCYNTLFQGNMATSSGGGAYGGELFGCTLVLNWAGVSGGGSSRSRLRNCIIYFNTAPEEPNYSSGGSDWPGPYGMIEYSCTWPLPINAPTVITNDPAFVSSAGYDFRLASSSPCINAGYFNYHPDGRWWVKGPDLDGSARVFGGTVDMGAYESQTSTSVLSYEYAQQYGLPTDGSLDFLDSDGDGMDNYSEWISGTNPTNDASVLRILSVTKAPLGNHVSWSGSPSRRYVLQRTSNLSSPSPTFNAVGSEVQATNRYDQTADPGGTYFYRVAVPHHVNTNHP